MQTPKLPEKSAPLSNTGIQKLLEIVKNNPTLAQSVANELERNPREVIKRYFRQSVSQQNAIENTPDDILKVRSATLVSALRNGLFEAIKYGAGVVSASEDPEDGSANAKSRLSGDIREETVTVHR